MTEDERTDMKIRMTVTLEVNEEAWANEYNLHASEVREDAKEHLTGLVSEHIQAIPHIRDGLATVTRFE
jgi:hypothetical protein